MINRLYAIKFIILTLVVSVVLINFIGLGIVFADSNIPVVKSILFDRTVHTEIFLNEDYDEPLKKDYYFGELLVFDYGEFLITNNNNYIAGIAPTKIKFNNYANLEVLSGLLFIETNENDFMLKIGNENFNIIKNSKAIVNFEENYVFLLYGEAVWDGNRVVTNQIVRKEIGQYYIRDLGQLKNLQDDRVDNLIIFLNEIDLL